MKLERTKQAVEALDADLSGSTFTDVNLSNAVFRDVNLTGAVVHDANLSRVRISNADLRGASLADCRTDGMTIDGIAVEDLLAAYRAGVTRANATLEK
jgi:uncharacterized protein YjbI with pentapeptide repeats